MESRRQQKIGKLIQKEISSILQKDGPTFYGSALVTITHVRMTPDLLTARVYLSIYNSKTGDEILDAIVQNTSEIRFRLGNSVRNQLRRVPELEFYIDDTLDTVFRMEKIFKDLHEENNNQNSDSK